MEKWVLIFLVALPFASSDYYVSPTGTASWAECTDIAKPCSLDTANSNAVAGDIVFMRAGSYNQHIEPRNSGTSSNKITFQGYNGETVTIHDTAYGIFLDGNEHIAVLEIDFYNLDKFMWLDSANYNTIAYCTFDQGRDVGWSGSKIYRSSTNNWIHHCEFSRYGYYTGDDIGSVIDIGTEEDSSDQTQYNLIEDSTFYSGGHHVFGLFGRWNVIRNNHMHNEKWSKNGGTEYGNRVLYITGTTPTWGENLIEGNRIGYSSDPPDNDGATTIVLAGNYNIVRKNDIFRASTNGISLGCGSAYPVAPSYNRVYNNNIFDSGQDELGSKDECGIYHNNWGHPDDMKGNIFKNNIFYSNGCSFAFSSTNQDDQIIENNWEESGDPRFTDTSGTDPGSVSNPDFTLQSDSPCIDIGGYLTTISSATGNGNSFVVEDSRYFTDGWDIIQGDIIQLEGSAHAVQIVSIDYQSGSITIDQAISWTQGQGIALAYEGSAPDIGAHEFQVVGCGNGNCETGEDSSNCPQDCHAGPECGDGACDDGETCETCEADCGACCIPVTTTELSVKIQEWKQGNINMQQVMEAIATWKSGC